MFVLSCIIIVYCNQKSYCEGNNWFLFLSSNFVAPGRELFLILLGCVALHVDIKIDLFDFCLKALVPYSNSYFFL